jgi:hypothetical protein
MRSLALLLLAAAAPARADVSPPAAGEAQRIPWQQRYDLDGDGRRDRIEVSFSGGAHCCYTIAVWLSSTGKRLAIPFEIDGGYVGGLDLSRKEHFDVFVQHGGGEPDEPVLKMEILTYGSSKLEPIPRSWRRRWGVDSHYIAVHLRGGRMRVENLLPPPAARGGER